MPRISVIIPTYNCARFLGRALDSVLSQTYTDYELLVVDDGSTDETYDVVTRYGKQVVYLQQSNRGASAARNLALSRMRGELIAYLDADDMWYPQKLERQVAFLDSHKECGFVHSEVDVINEEDQVIRHRFNQETERPVPQGYCTVDLLRRCHIQTLTVMERRSCLNRAGMFDERLPIAQDYMHWIMVVLEGMAVGYIDEPLGMYRWRTGSLMSSQRRLWEDYARIYELLLDEKSLGLRCGKDAADLARDKLYGARRELAYLDRTEGRTGCALRRIISLIGKQPHRAELYMDFLKTCVPAGLGARLRTFRKQVADGG